MTRQRTRSTKATSPAKRGTTAPGLGIALNWVPPKAISLVAPRTDAPAAIKKR